MVMKAKSTFVAIQLHQDCKIPTKLVGFICRTLDEDLYSVLKSIVDALILENSPTLLLVAAGKICAYQLIAI